MSCLSSYEIIPLLISWLINFVP
uniref:Uncharacterized protein n=1 Tax=Rhizophora mucronata TaxID=61149 RepID=A0A2P2QJQ7_RHIMU